MKTLSKNLYVSGQLVADDFPRLAAKGIKTIVNNRPDNEETGQLDSRLAKHLAEENGINYVYLPMENGRPLPSETVDKFHSVLSHQEGSILAHCRSGLRSSLIWAVGVIKHGEHSIEETLEAADRAQIPLRKHQQLLQQITEGST